MFKPRILSVALSALILSGCSKVAEQSAEPQPAAVQPPSLVAGNESRLDIYYPVKLNADLSHLSDNQKAMLSVLIDASKIMDNLFWQQAYGKDKKAY